MRRVLLAIVALATGCTFFTSLDGLSGGPTSEDAGSKDAEPVDATQPDGGTGRDGGADAPVDAPPDVAKQGCASLGTHTFCDDFDDASAPIVGTWSFGGPGAATPETSLFVSAPRSVALVVAKNSPSCSYAELWRTFGGTFHRAKVSAAVRLGATDATTLTAPATVFHIAIGPKCSIDVQPDLRSNGVYIENDPTGNPGQFYDLSTGIDLGTWARLTATFDTTTSPYVTVDIDGQNVVTVTSLVDVCKLTGNVSVGVGPHCVRPGERVETRFDDVTIDTE